MPRSKLRRLSDGQTQLLSAALQYCAVADWFESHPCRWRKHMSVDEAMAHFNRVESALRDAGGALLRQLDHSDLVLEAAGIDEDAW